MLARQELGHKHLGIPFDDSGSVAHDVGHLEHVPNLVPVVHHDALQGLFLVVKNAPSYFTFQEFIDDGLLPFSHGRNYGSLLVESVDYALVFTKPDEEPVDAGAQQVLGFHGLQL